MSSEKEEEAVDGFFGFGLFEGVMDDIDAQQEEVKMKKASQFNFEAMLNHIGGFEYWSVLNEDCKEVGAKFLDYKTLTKLGMCSKTDNALVNKIPIHVDSISILDNERLMFKSKVLFRFEEEDFDNVIVLVEFYDDFNSRQRFELVFSQIGEDTQVRYIEYFLKKEAENRSFMIEKSNYYEEAVKYAEKWMKRGQFQMEEITVEMSKYPFETSIIRSLPKCTNVRIGADDMSTFNWWIDKVPEQLDSIEIVLLNENRDTFTLPTDFLIRPQVMDAEEMFFRCRAPFSDEQFLNLKVWQISFGAVNITDDGVNAFLKKWVSGKMVNGFGRALLWSTRVPEKDRVMRGLDVRPWDDDFKTKKRGFCKDFERYCGRGDAYQIKSQVEPFDSLTLLFSDDRISIYWTGRKTTSNGKTFTDYYEGI